MTDVVKKTPAEWLKEKRFARYTMRADSYWARTGEDWNKPLTVNDFANRITLSDVEIGEFIK